MGRIFCIPDIHGRYDLFQDLLHQLTANHDLSLRSDKLIFLGDMIDRGPESNRVLYKIKELTEEVPGQVVALAGNHEWLAIDACRNLRWPDIQLWCGWNGGKETLKSFKTDWVFENQMHNHERLLPVDLVDWMASLPITHEEPGFFFSHAPVPNESFRMAVNRGKPYTKEELIWTHAHDEAALAVTFADKIGVCGHIHGLPQSNCRPRLYPHYIFADAGCGCYYKAPLVAIEVKSREVVYSFPVEAIKTQEVATQ